MLNELVQKLASYLKSILTSPVIFHLASSVIPSRRRGISSS